MRLSIFAAAALLTGSLAAHATMTYNATPSTTTPPNGLVSSYSGVTTLNFDGSTALPFGFTGGTVVQTSSSGNYAAPNGDTSNFYIVGTAPNFMGSATFSPGAAYNYFGLYWGSIDSANTLTFLSNGTQVGSISGSQLLANYPNTNEFVDVFFAGGTTYDSVAFTTPNPNFELDNVTYGNVAVTPEPSTFVMLGTGVLGVAGVIKRRLA
ncbi:MAG: Npun_F0296 family exosortase-dependent surface protein [Janthinobacterium lividum]